MARLLAGERLASGLRVAGEWLASDWRAAGDGEWLASGWRAACKRHASGLRAVGERLASGLRAAGERLALATAGTKLTRNGVATVLSRARLFQLYLKRCAREPRREARQKIALQLV